MPYRHPNGPNPHHVIEAEILTPAADAAAKGKRGDGFTEVVDNARIRASRLLLEPGRSAELGAGGRGFVVVVKGGPSGSTELKPGAVEWHDGLKPVLLKNDGASTMELVEIQVK
jgi:hypothetical protein